MQTKLHEQRQILQNSLVSSFIKHAVLPYNKSFYRRLAFSSYKMKKIINTIIYL